MFSRSLLTLAALALPAALFAQSDAYQVSYVSNLNLGDSVINITNAGTNGGYSTAGDVCVNVYAFDPNEEMQSCCSCYTTPNGLYSLSARRDLVSNTLTGHPLTSIVVKLVATRPVSGGCNAGAAGTLAPGIRAWGTHVHAAPGYTALTETQFAAAGLSGSEYSKLTSQCSFVQVVGSGFGICNSCRTGGLVQPKL